MRALRPSFRAAVIAGVSLSALFLAALAPTASAELPLPVHPVILLDAGPIPARFLVSVDRDGSGTTLHVCMSFDGQDRNVTVKWDGGLLFEIPFVGKTGQPLPFMPPGVTDLGTGTEQAGTDPSCPAFP